MLCHIKKNSDFKNLGLNLLILTIVKIAIQLNKTFTSKKFA